MAGLEIHLVRIQIQLQSEKCRLKVFRIRELIHCIIGITIDTIIHQLEHIIILIRLVWEEQDMIGRQHTHFHTIRHTPVMLHTGFLEERILLLNFGSWHLHKMFRQVIIRNGVIVMRQKDIHIIGHAGRIGVHGVQQKQKRAIRVK